MSNSKSITDFKDLRKAIEEIQKNQPAQTRYQQQAEKMGYRQEAEKKKKKWKEPLKGYPGNEAADDQMTTSVSADPKDDVKDTGLKAKPDHAGEEEIKKAYKELDPPASGSVENTRKLIQIQLKKMGYNTYSKFAFDSIFKIAGELDPNTKKEWIAKNGTKRRVAEKDKRKKLKEIAIPSGLRKIDGTIRNLSKYKFAFGDVQKFIDDYKYVADKPQGDQRQKNIEKAIKFLGDMVDAGIDPKIIMRNDFSTNRFPAFNIKGQKLSKFTPNDLAKAKKVARVESVEEGKMSDLLIDIQQGATAKELARDFNISLATAKNFLKDYYGQKKGGRKEDVDEGKYLKYSDLLLKKSRLIDKEGPNSPTVKAINKEIGKEMKKLGISEGYQVYVKSAKAPSGWIAQGQPWRTLLHAKIDAKNFAPEVTKIVKEENIQEGTWAVPDSREKIEKLNNWLSQPRRIKVEKEADLVWNTISGIVGDDDVADEWNTMISMGFHGKTGDAREPVVDWLKDWGFKLSGYKITHAPASYLEGVGESKEQTEGSFSQGWRKLKKKGRIKKPMKKPISLTMSEGMNSTQKKKFDALYKKMDGGKEHMAIKKKIKNQVKADDAFHALVMKKVMGEESRSQQVKEDYEHAKQSPFKLKSQQYPRAIAINTKGHGKRHAVIKDITEACDSFGMITDKELQIEQIQKQLGKLGFISYTKSDLDDVFEERETVRMIYALESMTEEQTPIEYTKNQVEDSYIMSEEVEFVKPDGQKTAGPVLKLCENTFNVKDKYTGKSFTYKYINEENKVRTFRQITEVELHSSMLRKDFPNVWATKDSKLYRVLAWLVSMHGFTTNLSSYKKDKKGFLDSLKNIAKSDANMKKAGMSSRDIQYIKKPKPGQNFAEDIQEGRFSKKLIKQAGGIAFDKRYYMGNMSGAIDAIEKLKKGLSDDPKVKDMLRIANESNEPTAYTNWLPEGGDKEAYQKFFNAALKKFGVSSPDELEGDKKKEFFDYVDKNWKGDHEEKKQDVHKSKVDGRTTTFREKMRKLGYIKDPSFKK